MTKTIKIALLSATIVLTAILITYFYAPKQAAIPLEEARILGIPLSEYHLNLRDCDIDDNDGNYTLQCGWIKVPQNYAVPATESKSVDNLKRAKKVYLPIAVFSPPKQTDVPLLIAGAGGPGGSLYTSMAGTIDASLFYESYVNSSLSAGRQLIYIDMRGVYGSKPFLDCSAEKNLVYNDFITGTFDMETYKVAIKDCADYFASKNIDLNDFNIDTAVKDIDAFRQLLKLDKWHVYGASHSSRIALHYAREFSDHTKSLILDSLYPFEIDSLIDLAALLKQATTQAFTNCDADKACSALHGGNTMNAYNSVMASLNEQAIELNITHENLDYEQTTSNVRITANTLESILQFSSYDIAIYDTLPELIMQMHNKNYDLLTKSFKDYIDFIVYDEFAEAAYSSYSCYEEFGFSDLQTAIANAKEVNFDTDDMLKMLDSLLHFCKAFDVKPAKYAIKSYPKAKLTMPVLILAGALDAATPLYWAEQFYQKLPQQGIDQHLLVWPDKVHGVLYDDPCADKLVASFLSSPKQALINTCEPRVINALSQQEKSS